MAWAITGRIGCAAAQYDRGFAYICNYYVSDRLTEPSWAIGEPCSRCPRNAPLCSSYFESLCTAGMYIQI